MLLLRCSLLADSISRSISFWPSTIATRSSSAWVALNSMRFIVISPARISAGARRTVKRRRPSGRPTSRRWALARKTTQAAQAAWLRGVGCGDDRASVSAAQLPLKPSPSGEGAENKGCLSREYGSFSSRCRSNGLAAASLSVIKDRVLQPSTEFVALRKWRAACPSRLSSGHKPVRRLRCSINIVTFPGCRIRTVKRYNQVALFSGQQALALNAHPVVLLTGGPQRGREGLVEDRHLGTHALANACCCCRQL